MRIEKNFRTGLDVYFKELDEGDSFIYNSDLYIKTSELCDNAGCYGGTSYNCVRIRDGRMRSIPDEKTPVEETMGFTVKKVY